MKLLRSAFIGLTIFGLISLVITANCDLRFGLRPPQQIFQFGSKQIILDAKLSYEPDEEVTFYCASGLKHDSSRNIITLQCIQHNYDNSFLYDDGSQIDYVECLGNDKNVLYESRSSLPYCEDYMTLLVGAKAANRGTRKLIAMCYDFDNLQLKYVAYTAYLPNNQLFEQEQVGQLHGLDLDIQINSTQSILRRPNATQVNNAFKQEKELMQLISSETFEYASLIQDEIMAKDLLEFEHLLNIVWLRTLRIGNWRLWLNALRASTSDPQNDQKYDVRVGVSGSLALPNLQLYNITSSIKMNIEVNGSRLYVPEHIWAHVRSLSVNSSGASEEFVLVAHNSPLARAEDTFKFCVSMCQEIPWLSESVFSKTQDYIGFGLMQCCRVNDVTNKLDNFRKSGSNGNLENTTEANNIGLIDMIRQVKQN